MTMTFAEAARRNAAFTRTENGAAALNTTGNACLDFFATAGALRGADEGRISRLFSEAWREDPLTATRTVFYMRDIRGGLGERRTFRTLLRHMAAYCPEALYRNLDLVGVYGRYDDLYCLIGTPLENAMWETMKRQFEEDRANLDRGYAVSLLAKWIKTADASSGNTRRLGILTAKKLGYSVYDFKRLVRAMRRQIGIVESMMSAGRWGEIRYSAVPSRAMTLYRKAFMKHDAERYGGYIHRAVNGVEKIHSAALYPYDIMEKVLQITRYGCRAVRDDVLEAQWRQLPDYVEKGTNVLVIADTSGSMYGRPLATALGLAVYFAERNTGAYHNMFMSFSCSSDIQVLRGGTLAQKIGSINMSSWGCSTNLRSAFENILGIAVKNRVSPSDMPKSLVVISDMEIDACTSGGWAFYDFMARRFSDLGYRIPNVVFWNVDSRHDVFHADASRRGVQLVGGQSASVFRQVMRCVGMTPVEAMMKTVHSERYAPVTVSGIPVR